MRIMVKKESLKSKIGAILLILAMIASVGVVIWSIIYTPAYGSADNRIRDIWIGRYTIADEPVYKNGEVYFQMNDTKGITQYYAMQQKFYQEYFPAGGIHKGDIVEFTKDKGIITSKG